MCRHLRPLNRSQRDHTHQRRGSAKSNSQECIAALGLKKRTKIESKSTIDTARSRYWRLQPLERLILNFIINLKMRHVGLTAHEPPVYSG